MRIFLIIIGALLAGLAFFFSFLWYPGITPSQTASILVHDDKFGSRALPMARLWGDYIFPPMREYTDGFELRRSSAFAMARILIENDSAESLKISEELYRRQSIPAPAQKKGNGLAYYEYQANIVYPKIVGAIGLGAHGKLPKDAFDNGGFLYSILNQIPEQSSSTHNIYRYADEGELELAIMAAQYSKNLKAVPFLINIIEKRPAAYGIHARACRALGAISAQQAIPVLREAMKAQNFHALPDAFRVLYDLGEPEAIPLAIARISPDLKKKSAGYVVKELTLATGEDFGFDREKWQSWYNQKHR